MRYVHVSTGEVVEVLAETPELLVMQATWPAELLAELRDEVALR